MKRSRLPLVLGLSIIAIFLLFSLFPSFFAPYGLKEMDLALQMPNIKHPLGTNDLGYDILTELIYASRNTLSVGLFAAFISLFIGTLIGVLAGFLPSWKGEFANALIQVFLMIPMLPMAIVLGSFLGERKLGVILTISLLGWSATARTVRLRTQELKQSSFVEGLVIVRVPRWRILLFHIIPNLYDVVLSRYLLSVSSAIMVEATLSFLGMGDPTEVTWGRMMNLAYKQGAFLRGAYAWLFLPGICIAMIIIAFYSLDKYIEDRFSEVDGIQSYLD